MITYAQKFFFEILFNQTEIRFYLPFSDLFGTKRTSLWFSINLRMVNTIWFRFNLIRFRKDFSVCRLERYLQPLIYYCITWGLYYKVYLYKEAFSVDLFIISIVIIVCTWWSNRNYILVLLSLSFNKIVCIFYSDFVVRISLCNSIINI